MELVSSSVVLPRGGAVDAESRPRYRADVDGLRAIAILSVVLYHARLPLFDGGFVGVDVFFVISGYLIGGIVYRDVSRGRYSFGTFYVRRARRILPALLAMMLATAALALALLPPDDLRSFAKSAAAALFGSANIRFWALTHYFGIDWRQDPLVMTWSLGVEEQFYLFLPPLMLVLHRFAPRSIVPAIALLSFASMALSVRLTETQPSAAFYLLPGRAWELGIGVLAALWQEHRRGAIGRRMAEPVGAAGLAAVLLAIVTFEERTHFPGIAALLPTLGTAALIVAEPGWINRTLLAATPMRFVGLISYSWYLWHWPVMVFTRVAVGSELSAATVALVVLVSFAAAVLSWRFVEQPFRRRSAAPNGRVLLRYAAALLGCLMVARICYLAAGP